MDNVFDTIRAREGSQTKIQMKISAYILMAFQDVSFDSLDKTAEKIGVSKPSIISYAKSLGFTGYAELQSAIQVAMKDFPTYNEQKSFNLSSIFTKDADPILINTFSNVMTNIQLTIQSITASDLDSAMRLLISARRSLVVGLRESYAMAHYFYSRISTFNNSIFLANMADSIMYEQFLSFGEKDVCVFFMFHAYTSRAFDILALLKARHVNIIMFTNESTAEIEKYADCVIRCQVDGVYYRNSSAAVVTAIDYFINRYISLDYDTNLNKYTKWRNDLKKYHAY